MRGPPQLRRGGSAGGITPLKGTPAAAQLASFSLLMKGREDDRRLLERGIQLNVMALQDSTGLNVERLAESVELATTGVSRADLRMLVELFAQAKTFGSLIQVPAVLANKLPNLKHLTETSSQDIITAGELQRLGVLVCQAEILAQQYHAVVANPPYMGGKGMNPDVKQFLRDNYPDYKADLFAAFIVRALALSLSSGRLGFMSPFVWMFLSSYEGLRENLIFKASITTLVQLEYSGFAGATVPICTFTLQNKGQPQLLGGYIRLTEFRGADLQGPRTLEAIADPSCGWFYRTASKSFTNIPGSPIAYWISDSLANAFTRFSRISDLGETRIGLITGDNSYYIRFWYEVETKSIGFGLSREEASRSDLRWFPQSKGGDFRRWHGNHETVVNWHSDGHELQSRLHRSGTRTLAHNFNLDRIFQPAITWTKISSGTFSARLQPSGFLFNDASANLFINTDAARLRTLAFLNSSLCMRFLEALNPTLNFLPGNISSLPFPPSFGGSTDQSLISIAKEATELARTDWDNFEVSWDFRDQPLVRQGVKAHDLKTSWRNWDTQSTAAINRMQALETDNNRILIDAYGLGGELEAMVPLDQVTLVRADQRKDVAAFLSYATGCMMGRFSLDQVGLILADSRESQASQLAAYEAKVGMPLSKVQFNPDPDGIIPVLDGEWFEDDIVARTREFLAVTFPESSVAENLRFIEQSLGKDIRKYFCSDFYKDHLQTYKKRPIYWMVQSPKKGFACLIYLHRYTKDTLNQVLNNYFRPYLQKLEARLAQLGLDQLNDVLPARDRTAARKEAEKITKVLRECQIWEQDALLPLAQQRIELDLDDGVKVNYLKLQDVLAPIPGLAAKEE
ncbi:BREX-1 system adenine-specific DNA-methyltransferase PglX [Vulcanococcus limneticus]|uniref:BREX-1 system adenine-specific DNA-methyltransferase PglX n=1 Tax=Vulcanococcus limneticus TaxID=2170428 RepID=UPI0020CD29F1|nr:BREX-1 system adenine-specific DNA-methyltransferase PglX [Vulcanococcus limneticus]